MGLAAGYYHNFVYRMLVAPNYLHLHRKEFSRVTILMPNSLRSKANAEIGRLRELAQDYAQAHPDRPFGEPVLVAKDEDGDIRKLGVMALGREVLDVPTTAYALRQSPRYMRRLNSIAGSDAVREVEIERLEGRMLQQFRQSLEFLLRRAHQMHDLSRDVIRIADIPETAQQLDALLR